jgi:hypothetical protein
MVTEDHVGLLGEFSLNLLGDDHFNILVSLHQQGRVAEMLSTKPEDTAARESIYAQIQGLNAFIAFVGDIAKRHDAIVNPPPVDEDALVDDPDVHNIFEE